MNEKRLIALGITILFGGFVFAFCTEQVDAGHVKVGTLFGDVDPEPIEQGFHFVNPIKNWHEYDCREKTHFTQQIQVSARDEQTLTMDISIQFRVIAAAAATIKQETGTVEEAVEIHMVPKFRSLVRETGKGFTRLEDFFEIENQQKFQNEVFEGLRIFCAPHGIQVSSVLMRQVTAPQYIQAAIADKKIREQQAEKQQAELDRFRIEQQQKVETARAELEAAEEEAKRIRTIAEAKAFEIEQINTAIAENPAYIQLEALKALQSISENPASQLYFMNADAPNPLPLMHMGTSPVETR